MQRLELNYHESLKTLRAYRDAVNAAAIVSITDVSGTILYVNEKFIEVSGYSPSELIGQNHRIINSNYHSAVFFEDMWATIRSGRHWRGEIRNRAKNGSYYWVDTVIVPLFNKENKIFQFLSVRNLITSQKENEEKLTNFQNKLMKREQQLKEAQTVSKTGSWHIEFPGTEIEWSTETYRIFEVPPGTPVSYERFLRSVHPDDLQRVNAAWQAALKGLPYAIEHRIVTPSGEKWVSERAKVEFDSRYVPMTALGTVQDITEKKKTEQILIESESLYKGLFNQSPFPKCIMDKSTLTFLEVNAPACKAYGYSREEFKMLSIYDIRVPEEHSFVEEQLFEQQFSWGQVVRKHRKKDGSIIYADAFISEITFKGKAALLITVVDITEKRRMERELLESQLSRQKEINRASLEAMENYRSEIGRELHDNVNQLLASANIFLRSAKGFSNKDQQALDRAATMVSAVVKEIRTLSWSLVSPALRDFTLKESLESLALTFSVTNTSTKFDIEIDEDILSDNFKVNLYRIIQEQFNNIIKYAGAAQVKIYMKQTDAQLDLRISDDGRGFDVNAVHKGIGLANIIHRAESYNGRARIISRPGEGCSIEIEFPLSPNVKE